MKIYIDMDGVLTSFVSGYLKWNDVDPRPVLKNWPKNEYQIENVIPNVAIKYQIEDLPKQFWSSLDETAEMNMLLLYCLKCFHRNNIYILSTPTSHKDCISGKLEWLDKHLKFMPRDRIIFEKEKWKYANPTSILIDDSDKNVNEFRQHGGYAILIPRQWNSAISLDIEEAIFTILKHYSGYGNKHVKPTT